MDHRTTVWAMRGSKREAGVDEPSFLAVAVGHVISHEALAGDMASLYAQGVHGWRVLMDVHDTAEKAPCWQIGLLHVTGRRERRRFQGVEDTDGSPAWCRLE